MNWVKRISAPVLHIDHFGSLDKQTGIGIMLWISNYIHIKLLDVFTHPCFNSGLPLNSAYSMALMADWTKPQLNTGHDDFTRYNDHVWSLHWPRNGCLSAPSPFLNQYWLIVKCVLWHSPTSVQHKNPWQAFVDTLLELLPPLPGPNVLILGVLNYA